MHTPRNTEIQNAFYYLVHERVVTNQTDVAKKLGVSRGLVSNILNNREEASEELYQKFENVLLRPQEMTFAQFKKKKPVKPRQAEPEATFEEVTTGQLTFNEMQNEVIIEMLAELLAISGGASKKELKAKTDSIKKQAFEKVRAKSEQVQAGETEK
jgi:transcriptional regulator with XRE-family HTH domain